jgi:photosystem II stability/assembly factor-like uncharacterized protein
MASKWAACLIVGASLNLGCTFITACPTPTGNQPGTGGSSSSGGKGSGGGVFDPNAGGSPGDDGEWVNVTNNLVTSVTGPAATCGNTYLVSAKPGEDLLIVGIGAHGLWATSDGGDTWQQLGTGADSQPIPHIPTAVVYDPQNPDVFWEAGIYDSGLFKTEDHGETFTQLSNLRHNELLSVDFTDPERKVILAGGHEQRRMLYLSQDAGMTFEEIGESLPSNAGVSSFPYVIDASTFLLGTQDFGGGVTGIFRTTDGGASWTQVGEDGGVWRPLVASDGNIYWSSDQGGGMVRSTDNGETFEKVTPTGSEITLPPIELPDGRIASVSRRYVVVSDDQAETWKPVSPELPFRARSLAYSPERKAFFITHETCEEGEANAVLRFDFDYEAP